MNPINPTTPDPPAPPAATLSYHREPTPDERPYGRADRAVFACCAMLAAANLALGALAFAADGDAIFFFWTVGSWLCFAAYMILWVVGQYLFWRQRPDLPPVSAFALVCVAALGLASVAANFWYTRMIFP